MMKNFLNALIIANELHALLSPYWTKFNRSLHEEVSMRMKSYFLRSRLLDPQFSFVPSVPCASPSKPVL